MLAGALAGGLALLITAALILRRRRKPPTLRLAAPAKTTAATAKGGARDAVRLDLQLDIVSATRSVMMFSIDYRLELANRTDRGLSDLKLAARLDCARRGAANAPTAGAAQDLQAIARIGAQQSRNVAGTLRIPIAELTILQQGRTPLFVPLVHLTIEGEGISAVTRTYVIGTPSAASPTRLHPLPLDTQPGNIPGLRAQVIEIPAPSARR